MFKPVEDAGITERMLALRHLSSANTFGKNSPTYSRDVRTPPDADILTSASAERIFSLHHLNCLYLMNTKWYLL